MPKRKLEELPAEDLAAALRKLGWRCYPRERVQVVEYSMTFPSQEWGWHVRKDHREWFGYQHRNIAKALGTFVHEKGCMLVRDKPFDYGLHLLQGAAAFVIPRPARTLTETYNDG